MPVYNLNLLMTPSQIENLESGSSITVNGITYQYNNTESRVVASNEA